MCYLANAVNIAVQHRHSIDLLIVRVRIERALARRQHCILLEAIQFLCSKFGVIVVDNQSTVVLRKIGLAFFLRDSRGFPGHRKQEATFGVRDRTRTSSDGILVYNDE